MNTPTIGQPHRRVLTKEECLANALYWENIYKQTKDVESLETSVAWFECAVDTENTENATKLA